MPIIRPSMSTCTPRACPSSGRNSEYGKLEPTISSVSQPVIRSQLGFVPSKPIEPVTNARSSGSTAFPSSAFATPAPSSSATSTTSSAALSAPAPTSIATFSPAFSTSAASFEVARRRDGPRTRIAKRRMDRPVRARRRLDRLHRGHVVWDDQTRDRALIHRDPHGPVDQVPDLHRRRCHLDVLVCDVFEQRREIDLLLIRAAQSRPRLLTHDRHHRLMIELRVVEAIQEMNRTRPRRR